MKHTDQLLSEIDSFLKRSGMAETTLGQKALRNSKLVKRLRSGSTVTLETANTLRKFMEDHRLRERKKPKGNAHAVAA